jgi:hypothetical protein
MLVLAACLLCKECLNILVKNGDNASNWAVPKNADLVGGSSALTSSEVKKQSHACSEKLRISRDVKSLRKSY